MLVGDDARGVRSHRHPGQQRRDHPAAAGRRTRRRVLGRGDRRQPVERVPAVPRRRPAHARARQGGKIVNVASLLSFQGGITVPGYAAAKGGVAQLTKALANEWARARHQRQRDRARLHGNRQHHGAPRRRRRAARQIGERIPAGRWGTPAGPGRRGGLPGLAGRPTTCTVTCWSSTAAGWDADDAMTSTAATVPATSAAAPRRVDCSSSSPGSSVRPR